MLVCGRVADTNVTLYAYFFSLFEGFARFRVIFLSPLDMLLFSG